jgi:hypothetical protein
MILQPAAIADLHIRANHTIGSDLHVRTDLGAGINDGGRVDLAGHDFGGTLVLARKEPSGKRFERHGSVFKPRMDTNRIHSFV